MHGLADKAFDEDKLSRCKADRFDAVRAGPVDAGLDDLDQYPRPAADVRMLQHVLRKAPVQEMEFRYDASERLIEQTAGAGR